MQRWPILPRNGDDPLGILCVPLDLEERHAVLADMTSRRISGHGSGNAQELMGERAATVGQVLLGLCPENGVNGILSHVRVFRENNQEAALCPITVRI